MITRVFWFINGLTITVFFILDCGGEFLTLLLTDDDVPTCGCFPGFWLQELDGLLNEDSLAGVPFLILGNKIDIPSAASEDELRQMLGLNNYTTGKGKVNLQGTNIRAIEVFMCSVVRRMGYGEGFRWLSQYI